jgi:hypothetical protein
MVLLLLYLHYDFPVHHETCLKKVLLSQQSTGISPTEAEVTVAVAQHLLGKLAPGDLYTIKKRGPCQCVCDHKPNFSSTGIGNL